MWPAIEAFLASIGAGAIAFIVLYSIHHWWTNRGDWERANVDWPRAYELLWERYVAQDEEIKRLRAIDPTGPD